MNLKTLVMAASLLAAPAALAHAPKVGDNGGPQVDAGPYHLELVMKGTALEVFLVDHTGKHVTTDGFKGSAILLVDGKPQRIPLAPAGDNRLSGTAPTALPAEPKGTVQITTSNGSSVQGRFN